MEILKGLSTGGYRQRAYLVLACLNAETAPHTRGLQPFAVDMTNLPMFHACHQPTGPEIDAAFAAKPEGDRNFLRLVNEATEAITSNGPSHGKS